MIPSVLTIPQNSPMLRRLQIRLVVFFCYFSIFDKWMELHEPYWKLADPRQYTFDATLAAYQLGVSVILEKYGY